MSRPLIEFIHSQDIPWSSDALRVGAEAKVLSEDTVTGDTTLLLRLPRGWWASSMSITEFFVLDGSLVLDGVRFGVHHYGYRQSGTVQCPDGALLLAWRESAGADDPLHIDALSAPWDRSALDSNIGHLNYARKNLRIARDGSCRTYLLGGMPHGFPAAGARLEKHPHAEEMFMIAGDMPCSLGVMTAGAYFYRPPGIWHGLDCTLGGFLVLMRTPGSSRTISEWSNELLPVSLDPKHCPEVPAGHAGRGAAPRSSIPNY